MYTNYCFPPVITLLHMLNTFAILNFETGLDGILPVLFVMPVIKVNFVIQMMPVVFQVAPTMVLRNVNLVVHKRIKLLLANGTMSVLPANPALLAIPVLDVVVSQVVPVHHGPLPQSSASLAVDKMVVVLLATKF